LALAQVLLEQPSEQEQEQAVVTEKAYVAQCHGGAAPALWPAGLILIVPTIERRSRDPDLP
jgi:hypothetical protein